ncbi:hypothetical protein C8R42DRAFT_709192 [Lentinula raphanica]|nr:hypothetical protein C8R42DRAFT_709192 [Lentinula raphanica]
MRGHNVVFRFRPDSIHKLTIERYTDPSLEDLDNILINNGGEWVRIGYVDRKDGKAVEHLKDTWWQHHVGGESKKTKNFKKFKSLLRSFTRTPSSAPHRAEIDPVPGCLWQFWCKQPTCIVISWVHAVGARCFVLVLVVSKASTNALASQNGVPLAITPLDNFPPSRRPPPGLDLRTKPR